MFWIPILLRFLFAMILFRLHWELTSYKRSRPNVETSVAEVVGAANKIRCLIARALPIGCT